MNEIEFCQRPTLLEKSLWWTEIGGFVAAFIGLVNHWAGWTIKGAVVFVGSKFALDKFTQSRRDNPSSTT